MGWLLSLIILVQAFAIALILVRRRELRKLSRRLDNLNEAKHKGSHQARLQYPHVDLSRCLGCGTCIRACPEEGVLDLIHGQAVVIYGARCVGHGLCAQACPVGAIDLTLGDLQNRRDIPALTNGLEVKNQPGLYMAGEVTGYALIRTAITHGTAIADRVAERTRADGNGNGESAVADPTNGGGSATLYDLCIVGAGPAGLAASLQARRHGLNFVTLEQEALGGTVAKYPRRKLVMTQPVALPMHGQLKKTSYVKEELMELWDDLAQRYELPIRTGEELQGIERDEDAHLVVTTGRGSYRARNVCLALGRRGTPRKLAVPGEELPKVAYSLIDAQSYANCRILVVGGGDSAVEAALGLAEQPGNEVTLSYRKSAFFRIKARNETRLNAALQAGKLQCCLNSQVKQITEDAVRLSLTPEDGPPGEQTIPNDHVFIMAGGIPPYKLLEKCHVSFDPADREVPPPLAERGTGLLAALYATLFLSIAIYVWVFLFRQYYGAAQVLRPILATHDWLRPSSLFGISCGVLATLLIIINLCYLIRRNWLFSLPGSLAAWMTSHVVTGVLALLLVFVHAAMSPQHTVGGHAFAGLLFLVFTGAVGRYFYSFVPRAANGKELALEELNNELAAEATQWDRYGRGFGEKTRQQLHALVAKGKWKGTFFVRLYALLHTQRAARDVYRQLRHDGREQGLSPDQIDKILTLAHRAYRTALISAHYEDLRAILNSWRFFHRWVALLMVLLAGVHIVMALQYGRLIP